MAVPKERRLAKEFKELQSRPPPQTRLLTPAFNAESWRIEVR